MSILEKRVACVLRMQRCFLALKQEKKLQTLAISIPSHSTIPPIHDSLDPLSRIRLRRLFAEKSFSELNKFNSENNHFSFECGVIVSHHVDLNFYRSNC